MTGKVKMKYESLEQRMISEYLALFPEFVPEECTEVSVPEQKEFYDLMKKLYQLLYENPSLIFPTLHEDAAFPGRIKKAYQKPKLSENVLKIRNTIEKLLQNMFLLGQGAEIRLAKRHLNILALLGIGNLEQLPAAWIWMSCRTGAAQADFTY